MTTDAPRHSTGPTYHVPDDEPPPSFRRGGWITFAGLLIVLAGVFNFVDGIVALQDAHWLHDNLVFGNLEAWGWTILVLGVVQFLVGCAILGRQTWAAYVGIVLAVLNGIAQLLYLPAYPLWSVIVIAIDVFVIYGLAVYGTTPASE